MVDGGKRRVLGVSLPASGATVAAALQAAGIKLNHPDRVYPRAAGMVRDGALIRVIRVATRVEKRYIGVPFELCIAPRR